MKDYAKELYNEVFSLNGDAKKITLLLINKMIYISDDSNEQRFLEGVKKEIELL